jgi:1-acyl-sn-glycerol-3-phosphate acyltransferase
VIARWLQSLRFWSRLTAFVLATVGYWGLMELDFLVRRRTPRIELVNKWVPRWAGTLLWLFGIRVEAHGPHIGQRRLYPGCDERGVGRIFVSNHRSGVDIPVVFVTVAAHVISRHDLAYWPLIGAGARRIGTLFVDRASRRSGATVLKQIARSLAAGEGIAMFPEGTAFDGDEVREFRPGAFTTAQRTAAQIVPLGMAYEDPAAYYTDDSFMDHMKRIARLRRLRVVVVAGEPLVVDDQSRIELKDHARERVQELVDQARELLGGQREPRKAPAPKAAVGLAPEAI